MAKIYLDRSEVLKKIGYVARAWGIFGSVKTALTDKIKALPAADVAPVKHAFNANEKYHSVDEFRCSECGIHIEDWTTFFEDEDDGEHIAEYEFRYCPNCGARMDGDG